MIIANLSVARMASMGVLIAAFLCAGAETGFAHSGTADEQQACTPDVFRLCSAQIPSETRIVACLNRNMAKLSPACRSVMRGDKPNANAHKKR